MFSVYFQLMAIIETFQSLPFTLLVRGQQMDNFAQIPLQIEITQVVFMEAESRPPTLLSLQSKSRVQTKSAP